MRDDEAVIRYLEEHIPQQAEAAVTQAYWQALAFGSTVLVREDDALVEVSPDGSRRIVRPLAPLAVVAPAPPSDAA